MRESYHNYMGRMMREDREKRHIQSKIYKHQHKINQLEKRLKELNES
jgi:hypothetical protein